MRMNMITLVTLNNLALANNDRMAAYQKAIELVEEKSSQMDCTDLLAFFSNYLNDSRAFSRELSQLAGNDFYQPEEILLGVKGLNLLSANSSSGKNNDRSQVLAMCHKEDVHTAKIYEHALVEEDIPVDTKNILLRQKEEVWRAQQVLESLLQRAAA